MILVLNPIINFVIYEAVKRILTKKGDKGVSSWKIFVASSLGKLMATLSTFPILTIRVKMQIEKAEGQSPWNLFKVLL